MAVAELERSEARLEKYGEADRSAKLRNLKNLMVLAKNGCDKVDRKSGYCSAMNCLRIHNIRSIGFGVFDSTFPLDDYDFHFLQPLAEAKRQCGNDCAMSRVYFKMAFGYLDTIIKALY